MYSFWRRMCKYKILSLIRAHFVILAATGLLLNGCATLPVPVAPQPPPPQPASPPPPPGGVAYLLGDGKLAVASVLRRDQQPYLSQLMSSGPVGFVLLNKSAGSAVDICGKFFSSMVNSRINQIEKNYIPTLWPDMRENIEVNTSKCNEMSNNYDYKFSELVMNNFNIQSVGPVFIAISGTYSNNVLILDLGKLPPSKVPGFIELWKSRIVQDPEQWQDGFRLEVFKGYVQAYLNEYGDGIVNVLTKHLSWSFS